MESFCKCCGKSLNRKQNMFCSNQCCAKYRKEQQIQKWKNGDCNGLKSFDQISSSIRMYMLEKVNYKCELCGWNKINPTTGKSPLEIHHIDGNYLNNKEENLQVLCPNCHSLTSNYKALNKDGRKNRPGIRRKKLCIDCGKPISYGAKRCVECASISRTNEKKITREELKTLIRTESFCKIGKHYSVTDNAIRKWCTYYNLPSKKTDINKYSDYEWETV